MRVPVLDDSKLCQKSITIHARTCCNNNTCWTAAVCFKSAIMDSGDAETRLQHKRNFLLFLENEPAYKTQVHLPAVV